MVTPMYKILAIHLQTATSHFLTCKCMHLDHSDMWTNMQSMPSGMQIVLQTCNENEALLIKKDLQSI